MLLHILFRQFLLKSDPDLPFYYATHNERYREEEEDFDVDDGRQLRLQNLQHNAREDGALWQVGKNLLPARNRPSLRQALHKPEIGLPPVPEHEMEVINRLVGRVQNAAH